MWECQYSREPVDYRLTFLRVINKIWIVPVVTVIVSLLVAGLYYCSKTVAKGGRTYQAESIFHIDYNEDGQGSEYDYYNFYTWSEVIHADFITVYMREAMAGRVTDEELAGYISATVESDVRYLIVRCNTHDSALSMELAKHMEEIVPAFADKYEEIKSIELVKKGDSFIDSSKIRMGNAFFLGALLGFFGSLITLIFIFVIDTSIFIPSSIERRYHIKTLGVEWGREFEANCKYLLGEAKKLAMVYVDAEHSETKLPVLAEQFSCENPVFGAEELPVIRECDAVVLMIKAGTKNAEMCQRVLDLLKTQDVSVTCAMLTEADEKMIKKYYRL